MTVTFGRAALLAVAVVDVEGSEQSGEMPKFFSAERGWSRSGERARRSRGEPGSADLGRERARCFAAGDTDSEAPGLKTCVECELPAGWCTWWMGNASGLGERVGDTGSGCCCGRGDGDGVRARGDSGMCPADFLRDGECRLFAFDSRLFLSPCSDDGRCGWNGSDAPAPSWPLAGLLGAEEPGELDGDECGESEAGLAAASRWRRMGGE